TNINSNSHVRSWPEKKIGVVLVQQNGGAGWMPRDAYFGTRRIQLLLQGVLRFGDERVLANLELVANERAVVELLADAALQPVQSVGLAPLRISSEQHVFGADYQRHLLSGRDVLVPRRHDRKTRQAEPRVLA